MKKITVEKLPSFKSDKPNKEGCEIDLLAYYQHPLNLQKVGLVENLKRKFQKEGLNEIEQNVLQRLGSEIESQRILLFELFSKGKGILIDPDTGFVLPCSRILLEEKGASALEAALKEGVDIDKIVDTIWN